MTEFLTAEQILDADDRPTETVDVPEWHGKVLVRGMDGHGRDEYFAAMAVQQGKRVVQDVSNASAKLCSRCIVNPDTLEPAFTQQQVDALGRKSAAALERVGQVAARLSGLSEEDMEELGKDSGNTPNGGSTSGSPPSSDGPSETPSGM
jgi:hypothetical protein